MQVVTFFLSESVCMDGCPPSLISWISLLSCSAALGENMEAPNMLGCVFLYLLF